MSEVFELSKRRGAEIYNPTQNALPEALAHLSIALALLLEMRARGSHEQQQRASSAVGLVNQAFEILSPAEGPEAA